ncbi:MAG: 16S rRNA (uracil(1498)-N(3))-methyltransferase [Clostridia bacterium]
MQKFFVEESQIENKQVRIEGEDIKHIRNVLRLLEGERIQVCILDTGENYLCQICKISQEEVVCNLLEKIESKAEPSVYIHLFQGLPKADKMELILQKCTEIGAQEFTPVSFKRCIVKLEKKEEIKKIERWQKIVISAAKQSKRDRIPKVNLVKDLKEVCNLLSEYDIVLVAYEEERINSLKKELRKIENQKENLKIAVVIGPEGGLENQEVEELEKMGAKVVTLGNRILRTETAPIVITSNIIYELENEIWGN